MEKASIKFHITDTLMFSDGAYKRQALSKDAVVTDKTMGTSVSHVRHRCSSILHDIQIKVMFLTWILAQKDPELVNPE